jgi:putative ABC transport system ATP-binding protein
MLSVRNLWKSYGGARARAVLRGISFELRHSEYLAIMGESGVGKSTLLNVIAGLDSAERGVVVLDGVELTALDEAARTAVRRSRIGFVFQAFHLLPHLTVAQNVALPLALNAVDAQRAAPRVAEILAAVGLAEAADAYPRELSGGEMQRAAIARALVHRPRLVLADEPTGNLDPETATTVLRLLREQVKHESGAGLLVTHSAAAAATADRVLALTAEGLVEARL